IEMLKKDYPQFLENVVFHGPVSREELNVRYAEAAFCIFPSHMETQGLVSLEAMLLKKPVIFSEYGPGPETIVHGETGLLCDVYEPEDIAEKMLWCIDHPQEAAQLGINAEKVVSKRYEKNTILGKNIDFYRSLQS
ncbi:MAG: glycosyltransferase family 4 protein, partial [Bacteroidota bacterium]